MTKEMTCCSQLWGFYWLEMAYCTGCHHTQ